MKMASSGAGLLESQIESLLCGGNNPEMRSVVGGNFGEPRGGDGARSARLCKDHFAGMWEEQAGDFVDGFVAERAVEQPDFAAGEILREEFGEFAGGSGIVRAVEVDVGAGLQFFQAAGPDGAGDSLAEGDVWDAEAASLEESRGSKSIESIFQLKAAGQTRSKVKGSSRRDFCHARMEHAVLLWIPDPHEKLVTAR